MRYQTSWALGSIAVLLFVLATSKGQDNDKGGFGGGGPGGFPGKGKGGFGGGGPGGFPGKGKGGFGGGGPGGFPGQNAFQGRGPGGSSPFGNPQGIDDLYQMAESDFNLRDRNGDGFLNMDEMPSQLKAELSRWDTNRDNLISLDEYKVFYVTLMQNRGGGPGNTVITILEEEDLDARPVVFRAGKLPKELPPWFKQLDTNRDGQVALYEWRKGGKDIDEFREWDRNDDGFITPEEALYKERLVQIANAGSNIESGSSPASAIMRGGKGPNLNSPADGFRGKGKGKLQPPQ
jgi:hypothetical protein